MPPPVPDKPLPRVVVDRNISNVPLAKGMYARGGGDGYGLLESSIARLGCYSVRKTGSEVFSGDALVVICPTRSVSQEYGENLSNYVKQGGKLLVIDSPENVSSTVSSVLWPFGLSIHHDRAWKGTMSASAQLPTVNLAAANEIIGGEAIGKLGENPVAALVHFGKGTVMAVGFGSLWNDRSLGEHAPKEARIRPGVLSPAPP